MTRNSILFAAAFGALAGAAGMIAWLNVVPGWGEAAGSWLGWARTGGFADWGPGNLGGLAAAFAGGWIGARRGGETRTSRLLPLAALVLGAWFLANVWLFLGLEIQPWFHPGDPTAG
jgi:hypothetical protein